MNGNRKGRRLRISPFSSPEVKKVVRRLPRFLLVAIYVMYLILGCFFDSISMMVLTLPFIAPVISDLGFSLLWFGVTYVLLAEVGLVTPPFGLNLFVLHGVVPKHGILTVARGALPFLIPTLFMVLLLTAFPEITLWLPSVLY